MMQQSPTSPEGKRLELLRSGFKLDIHFAPDASTCVVSYEPFGGPVLSEKDLREFIAHCGINTGLQEETVQEVVSQAAAGKALHGLLLAQGSPMVPGEDGRISLNRDGSAPAERSALEQDRLDFHQVQDFFNVEQGTLVATVLLPGEGEPGVTVFGAPIPAPPGKPVAVKLGKNVALLDDAKIVASCSGRVFCNGSDISVEDVYLVRGDVDYKTGNIDFNGFVEVSGDVLDGFKVRAAKGLLVRGNIGACSVSSDGDISFCGMNGQGSGVLQCGGTMMANFIYETRVEVAGDLLVESEIRLCGIRSLGSVRVNRRGIVGGECVALAGVDVASLGSVTSLHTRVVVGVNYHDLEEITRCFDRLKVLSDRQKQGEESKAERQATLQERAAVTALIREIRAQKYPEANPKLNVRKMLYGGVTVNLEMLAEEFRDERPGPFSMIENKVQGGLRFLELTELAVKACDLEEQFLKLAEGGDKG
ncbi:FapA family protein [Geomonas sp.]|uniref:DUF342 domain-containing protein n=1 Tax=Geomonas sp. TaxID=2651584 RepID=UPI002B46B37F|nr:FapA family protein [Geomonas sp.]HJV34196.1 FapA family protein [Geomonas sp.]